MADGADPSKGSEFDWREIPCRDEASARAQAERQQAQDSDDAEWIYLRHDRRWVARRTPRNWDPSEEPRSLTQGFLDTVLDPNSWF
jgi:hypothetical protein